MNEKAGKSRIVRDIMAKGFTARKSEKALNAVIVHMKLGLRRGEPVEVPGGTLQSKIRRGRPRKKLQRFRNINTRKIDFENISYSGRRRVVKFTPDLALDLTPVAAVAVAGDCGTSRSPPDRFRTPREACGQGGHGGSTTCRRASQVHAGIIIASPAGI
jgi:hypothetical protein